MVCYRPEGLGADMRLHDEHQRERVLHQDPRVASTVSIACLCIEVDVHRSLTCHSDVSRSILFAPLCSELKTV